MNIRTFALALAALFVFGLCQPALSQVTADERAKKSDEILKKVQQLGLMNDILPLVLTKDQLRKILPVVEKARQAVRDQEKVEYDYLAKLAPKVDGALKEALDKGKVPGKEVVNETWATFQMFAWKRKAIADENVQNVLKAFEGAVNEGQKKTAINSINPKQYDPTADPKTMSDAKKLELFIRVILLDPLSYDLLVAMGK
jgi:hypothetical protein